MPLLVKICGLTTPETVEAALDAGADLIGFVFHPKSPRAITPEAAAPLARMATGRAGTVALLVNPTIEAARTVASAITPDFLQLHGSETAGDVAALKTATGCRIIKAVGVATADDLDAIAPYRPVADLILIDAKPPRDAAYPGGHGRPFDWTILQVLDPALPFMLSGGLTPDTAEAAIRQVAALGVSLAGVDVSSGVESTPGVKDVTKIRAFVAAARQAEMMR